MSFPEIIKKALDNVLSKEEMELINDHGNFNHAQILLEAKILQTLIEMKKQEFEYWEAWKKAKQREMDN